MKPNRLAVIFVTIGLSVPSHAALQFKNAFSAPYPLNGIACDNTNTFVAAGENSTFVRATFSGTNGLPWVPGFVPSPGLSLKAATFGSGRFVVGGQNANNFSSADSGINWITDANAFSIPATVQGLAYNGGSFTAVSALSKIGYAPSASLAWADATIHNPVSLESYRAVTALGPSVFAACGKFSDIRTSPDGGVNWYPSRAVVNTTDPDLLGIAWDGSGNVVCVGAGGTILKSSSSGAPGSWVPVSSGTTASLNAVAYTGSGFIVAGNSGLILTSPDGLAWTSESSPTAYNLYGVAFAARGNLQGVAVLVGAGGAVVVGGTPPLAPTNSINQTNCALSLPNPRLSVTAVTNAANPLVTVDWYDATGMLKTNNSTSYQPTNTIVPQNASTNYTYYAVARDLRTGFTSTSVPTNGTPVTLTLNPRPTARLISLDTTNCDYGIPFTLTYTLTGLGPWTAWWNDGTVQTNTSSVAGPTNLTRMVYPTNSFGANTASNNVYFVTTVSNADTCLGNQPGDITGTNVVTVNPRPTATVTTETNTICSGQTTNVQAMLTGIGPWVVTWSSNGLSMTPVSETNRNHKLPVSPLSQNPNGPTDVKYAVAALTDSDASTQCTNNQTGDLSGEATIRVNPNVVVTSGPANLTQCPGTEASLSVSATGTGLAYQWYKGTGALIDQTNSSLTLSSVSETNADTYSVVVSGACGGPVTNSAILTVNPLPLLTSLGDVTNCVLVPNPTLTVNVTNGVIVDWYDQLTDGNLVATNTASFQPTNANVGTYDYYAQAQFVGGCVNTNRTRVSLVITNCPLTIAGNGGQVVLEWFGKLELQSAPALTKPVVWTTLTNGATGKMNYWTNHVMKAQEYFRLKVPDPVKLAVLSIKRMTDGQIVLDWVGNDTLQSTLALTVPSSNIVWVNLARGEHWTNAPVGTGRFFRLQY